MMCHASSRLGREEIAPGELEELQYRTVVERPRVRHIDDDPSVA
jgi:hypothetical protein